jgi:hypothetical protein
MTYQDGYQFSFDSAVYPPQPVIEPINQQIDPVSYVLASYIENLITNYLTLAFQTEWNNVGNTSSDFIVNGSGLGDIVINPLNIQLLQTTNYQYPIVALYREKEAYHQQSLMKVGTMSDFVLHYILPPLTQPQQNRLYPFLSYFSKIFLKFFFQGGDPLYQNYFPQLQECGLASVKLTGATYPSSAATNAAGQSIFFPNVMIRFQALEIEYAVPANYQTLTSIYIQENNINDGYAPTDGYNNLADGYVQAQITLTSISSASQPHGQPGTWIVVKGTGFWQLQTYQDPQSSGSPNVSLAGVPAAAIIIKSTTLMLVLPGVSLQAISGPLVVIDILGNTYQSSFNFTYL